MYDLAIIGAGAAGIKCAKLARKAGLHTALIELDQDNFGGTCINYGCIPTKFFLNSAKSNKSWQDAYPEKEKVIGGIKNPLLSFLKKQQVDIFWGKANFLDKNNINVSNTIITAKQVIIATGAKPKAPLTHPKLIFAEQLFSQPSLPGNILIIGAGYVGLEMSSLLQKLGKAVTLIEREDRILPAFDSYLANRLRAILEKKGLKIYTKADPADFELTSFDLIIAATGREPDLSALGIENIGLTLNEFGWIETDKFMKTNIENIYACGDVTGKSLLAYVAEYQARICIDSIMAISNEEDYSLIPECVFSIPQVAKVGILEEQAREKNIKYSKIKSNFLKFSSAYVYNDKDGYIEIITDEKDRILGAGIISREACELINILTLCIKNSLRLSDLKKTLLVHPTLSEIISLLAWEN